MENEYVKPSHKIVLRFILFAEEEKKKARILRSHKQGAQLLGSQKL